MTGIAHNEATAMNRILYPLYCIFVIIGCVPIAGQNSRLTESEADSVGAMSIPQTVSASETTVPSQKNDTQKTVIQPNNSETSVQTAAETELNQRIRVATYNINYGSWQEAEPNIEAIRSICADILFIQETNRHWEAIIRTNFKKEYPYMVFKDAAKAGGMAVLSKYSIKTVKWHKPPKAWFHGWIVVADTPLGGLQFLGVHLKPSINHDGSVTAESLADSATIRSSEIVALYKLLDASLPTIIPGDFNENEMGLAIQWLSDKGFSNALSQFDHSTHTWEWKVRDGFTLRDRLDHILYSYNTFQCIDSYVIKKGISDHFPVVSILEKKNEKPD
ncbi:MAG: endonuclease/exonuclease/phosphatase family protein [Planctomycetota bacterium]